MDDAKRNNLHNGRKKKSICPICLYVLIMQVVRCYRESKQTTPVGPQEEHALFASGQSPQITFPPHIQHCVKPKNFLPINFAEVKKLLISIVGLPHFSRCGDNPQYPRRMPDHFKTIYLYLHFNYSKLPDKPYQDCT